VESVEAAAATCAAPVIVVGHSMGGMVITQAAANAPELFSAMIYLCAFVPLATDSVFSLGRQDRDSLVSKSVTFRPTAIRVRKDRAGALFYSNCLLEDAEWAASRLCPEPLLPQFGRFRARNPIDLPRAYVECTQDRALSISWQRSMASRASIGSVITMDSDHSPFLSAPEQLVDHLVELARLAG
jgi:pimeloyl-ACP methyl ester carboxylesterase